MKTNKKDFDIFEKAVYSWQDYLGLLDWNIYVFHQKTDDTFATTATSIKGRAATICLNTNWNNRPITESELKECALHECLHIMTAPLFCEAQARYANEFQLDVEEHSLVVRLTNIIIRED